ncbi:DUF4097 family beta strand repeat-containing protein [Streptomyces kunmingensis]|uniref:DUF4097 family beta strand repeat-containing protein n=1 Tax=Streptomyces kunmingensis TaxID=68225 RepID=A0ABU6CIW0_9ACTN|nr:DUF4097 family beta strand repeat-containing protein [Streptomyces kunmingensis]MEB3964384.1 DUF4097 family beta strand repeat-containing protein [Streptomyces kunmingensis]
MASSDRRLTITTDNGLRLRPTDGDRIRVDPAVSPDWSRDGRTQVLDLSCHGPDDQPEDGSDDRFEDGSDHRSDRPCPRMPEIEVPAGTAVTVTARNAGIDVAGVTGSLDLTTVNGDVTVAGSGNGGAPVRLATRNGSVHATDVSASALRARTVNGDVTLGCATAPHRISGRTVNGSVDVAVPHDSPAYRVTATTDHGRPLISVPTGSGRPDRTMALATVNGDVRADRD